MSPFGTVCAKCGAGMPMGVKFCGKCGATLEAETPPAKKETPPVLGPGVRALLIVWGLGLLAGLLLGRAWPPAPAAPLERAADRETENAEALLARAHAASDNGQFSEAAGLYKRALPLAPSNPSLLVDLGIAQVALGDDASARASFKSALLGRAPHPAALYNLGLLAERNGNPERARVYYARYLALDPGGSRAAKARAKLAEDAGGSGEEGSGP